MIPLNHVHYLYCITDVDYYELIAVQVITPTGITYNAREGFPVI